MRQGLARTLALAIAIAVVAGAYLLFLATPAVPANAAQEPITRTVMTGPIAPDIGTEDGAEVPPVSPSGQLCLPRIERTSGWADVCWDAYRVSDSDPQKDYYNLRVYGSYQSTGVIGIRWFVVKSRLVDPPLDNVYDGWPTGTYDGPCQELVVELMFTEPSGGPVMICGHTTSGPGEDWTWESRWSCSPCWPFDTGTRELGLYGAAGVAQGTIPAWDIYVDFGS